MRLMLDWLSPQALAISRVDQCVAASGWLSSVRASTCSTCLSLSLREVPGRGSSNSPSLPALANRFLHFPTVCGVVESFAAIDLLFTPCAASKIIRDRKARACAVLGRRLQLIKFQRCSAVTITTDTGRPLRSDTLCIRCKSHPIYGTYFRLGTLAFSVCNLRLPQFDGIPLRVMQAGEPAVGIRLRVNLDRDSRSL
jgi:hypothetical protein